MTSHHAWKTVQILSLANKKGTMAAPLSASPSALPSSITLHPLAVFQAFKHAQVISSWGL